MPACGYKPLCQEGARHGNSTLDSGSQSANVSFSRIPSARPLTADLPSAPADGPEVARNAPHSGRQKDPRPQIRKMDREKDREAHANPVILHAKRCCPAYIIERRRKDPRWGAGALASIAAAKNTTPSSRCGTHPRFSWYLANHLENA